VENGCSIMYINEIDHDYDNEEKSTYHCLKEVGVDNDNEEK